MSPSRPPLALAALAVLSIGTQALLAPTPLQLRPPLQHRGAGIVAGRPPSSCMDHVQARRPRPSSLVDITAKSSVEDDDDAGLESSSSSSFLEEGRGVRCIVTGLAWLGFITYAFTLAPGSSEAARALDQELLQVMIANPFDPRVNPIFTAIFNALGIMPFIYACLLLPGARGQKPLPAAPFVAGSFALGFFSLGPYLAARRFQPSPAPPASAWVRKAVESKLPAVVAFVSSLGLVWYALAGGPEGLDVPTRAAAYAQLFRTQMFVHVSSLDLTVLSLFVFDAMREDAYRRGWHSLPRTLALASLPVVGPALYLVLRPALPVEEE